MTVSFVDLTTPKFWLFVIAGTLILTPLRHARARNLSLAMLNLTFVATLLGMAILPLLAALLVVYGVLCGMGGPRMRRLCVPLMLVGATLLFVCHKLPSVAGAMRMTRFLPILAAIGYSYVFLRAIDVSRATWERRHPPPGPIDLINYLLPFHMLAAGPIQAWDDYVAAPRVPEPLTRDAAMSMFERIANGLFKKFVLAFAVTRLFLTKGRAVGMYGLFEMNMAYIWLYLDFSAYSDIAVGVGGLMGIVTPENFRRPYFARNITDFWERWHISLSLWIRRNLFFPMQIALVRRTNGRYSLVCASIAIFIAFVLCGAWHGLTAPFLMWGLANAVGLVVVNLYRTWLKKRLGSKGVARYMASVPIRVIAVVLTFEFVAFTIKLIADK